MLRITVSLLVVLFIAAACAGPGVTDAPPTETDAPSGEPGATAPTVESLYQAAQEEGELLIYTSMDPDRLGLLIERFQEAYPGIEVDFFEGSTDAMLQRAITEARAGNQLADVAQESDFALKVLDDEGLAEPFIVPEMANLPPFLVNQDGLWVTYEITPAGIAWNTDLVQEPPTTFDELTDPIWKGRLILNDDAQDVFTALGVHKFGGPDPAREWLEGIAANEPVLQAGPDTVAGILAAGGAEVYVGAFFRNILGLQEEGAHLDYSLEEVVLKHQVVGVFKGAPHPNAARLWADFMVTLDVQTFMGEIGRLPALEEARGDAKVLPEDEDAIYPTDAEAIEQFTTFSEIWKDVFDL